MQLDPVALFLGLQHLCHQALSHPLCLHRCPESPHSAGKEASLYGGNGHGHALPGLFVPWKSGLSESQP